MGRRKIEILPIQHDRNRSVTFLKSSLSSNALRKNGLFKKAYELGVLCSVDVAVIIFGHNNKVYEYCSTDSDAIVQRRLHYTGERDVKTPADFGGDKANNDDDEDGSDDAAGGSRLPATNGKFPPNNKKRSRDDEPPHLDYSTAGQLLNLQQSTSNARAPLPNISSLARGPPPVSLPLPPYASIQSHPQHHAHAAADALIEREREREREREGALRQLGLHHLLNSTSTGSFPPAPPSAHHHHHHQAPGASQFPPHSSHPSLVPNLNLASLLQAHPLLGLGVPGLNLGLSSLLGLNGAGLGGGAPGGGGTQQELLAMLSANAANVSSSNALYSNPLFSTLFPNHPGLGGDPNPVPTSNHASSSAVASIETKPAGGGDIWPTLARAESSSASGSTTAGTGGSTSAGAGAGAGAGSANDTSWLSFLGNPRGSQPPSDDVDLSSLFPFDTTSTTAGGGADETGATEDEEERGGKRAKR
ncbi:hypothetical protein FRC09_003160 [Ceratobasidium sp. 395]|nr:hypothetical protein FRC09_003160 [Ceratobasidium sp. 395]